MHSAIRVLALACLLFVVNAVAADSKVAVLPSHLTLSVDSIKARTTDKQALAGGFTLKVSTGEVFDQKGKKQPLTFQYTEVVNAIDNTVMPANALQFATRETALAVRDSLAALFPSNRFVLVEHRKIGPYGNTFMEYGVKSDAPCTTAMNAGLMAFKILAYPEHWAFLFTLEASQYLSGPANCSE